jgi:hypothetical protein
MKSLGELTTDSTNNKCENGLAGECFDEKISKLIPFVNPRITLIVGTGLLVLLAVVLSIRKPSKEKVKSDD